MKISRPKLVQSLLWLLALSVSFWTGTALSPLPGGIRHGLYLGIALSALNGSIAFLTLAWAFSKSDVVFYGTFFGNMIWKLLVLFGTFLLLVRLQAVHIPAALISLAALTFLINLIEIGLFPSGSRP